MMWAAQAGLYDEQLSIVTRSWCGLADKPDETPEATLRALWFAAAGSPRSLPRAADPLPPLDEDAAERLRGLVRRRASGVPLAHLTGRQIFMGLEMLSGPGALIPRRETELLAATAIGLGQRTARERGAVMVLDVCTGSGNVALAIAAHLPGAALVGADISEEAVELARRNALHLGLAQRVTFETGDLFAPFEAEVWLEKVDLITCNPPYISSSRVPKMAAEISDHEPRRAFDGGAFGIDVVFRLISAAPRFLRPGGWLCFEVGSGQGRSISTRIERGGAFREVRTVADVGGDIRVIAARR